MSTSSNKKSNIIKNQPLLNRIFVCLFSIFLFTPLFSEGIKVKIYQTATVDLEKILTMIEEDDNFKEILEDYQSIQSSNIENINNTIFELEIYLDENPDLSSEKKSEILNDINFQKSQLKTLGKATEGNLLVILYNIIKKVAEREGFSLVIEKKTAIIYADAAVDITERVIREIKSTLR